MDYHKILKQTPESALKLLSIIHLAFLAGQMIFGLVAFMQSSGMYFGVMNMNDKFGFIAPVMAIGGFMGGYLIFQKQLESLNNKSSLSEKLLAYQSALISRFALLGTPSLFAIIAYAISGNMFFLFISGALGIYFLFLRPTRDKLESDLHFNFKNQFAYLQQEEFSK
jgi:hypothetical protein